MEKLRFTEQKTLNREKNLITEILLAIFACCSIIWTFTNMMDINIGDMDAGNLSGGFIYTWNKIAEAVGNNRYILMPVLEGQSSGNGFFLLLSAAILGIWNFFFIHQKKWKALCIPYLCIYFLGIFTGIRLDMKEIGICVIALFFMIIYVKNDRKSFTKRIVFMSLLLAFTLITVHVPVISDIADGNGKVGEISRDTKAFFENTYYGNNLLKNGDITWKERETSDDEALKITMEVPRSMYLRGFVGDIYTGHSWESLSESSYYGSTNLMYWLRQHGFNALGQVGQAHETLEAKKEKSAENYVEIEVLNADRRYAYIPYEINEEHYEKSKEWGGSFVTPSIGHRLNKYSYTVGENAVSKWTEIAAGIFSEAGEEGSRLNDYLIQESYYNEYVYDNFLYISESDEILLKTFIGDKGDQTKGHIGYKTAINRIRSFLDENFIYTENPGTAFQTQTTVLENFLTSKKGYDTHFATAAVMMFRYYGIPARYVEGYIVTPDDILNADENGTFTVSRAGIHAWPEIYIDGTGFVPIEVSSPYRDVMEEADMNIGISNKAIEENFKNSGKNQQQASSTNTGGDENRLKDDILFTWVIRIFFIIFIFLMMWITKRKIMTVWNRHRVFTKADPKTAVAAIFTWMEENKYHITQNGRNMGLCAAYSNHRITELERKEMLQILKMSKKEKKNEKRKSKKIFFNHYYCNIINNAFAFKRMWKGRTER